MHIRYATPLTGLHVSIVPRDDDLVKDLAPGKDGSHALVITDDNTEVFAVVGNTLDLDWFVRRINRQAVTSLREASRPEAGYILAAELDRDEAIGPFATEEDRLAVADRLLMALDIRQYDVVKRARKVEAPLPMVFSASRHVTVGELCSEPGMIVQRHTRQEEGSDHVETDLPCCARSVTVAADPDLEVELVCPFDRVRYTLRLAEEWDGGLLACWEMGSEVLLVKRRSAKRRAR
ncbi:hypothetical protein [Nonomuraea cavernae]|uniref:Uncharacterized protein n=1 Tax=Nonomuraea cavernae TaxID=2045107 RepID=A0A917YRN7_9ACTN|nr:hypothetical protein [Nonomuraea cavernae]MCA2184699.1 hypothetical protein [Nonomuraea cavernae]GGO63026.1 hypothetical protein GCM10012289_08980 [Nonomuraea cavernae]